MILGAKNYAKHTTANHSVVVKLDAGGWETIAFNYKQESLTLTAGLRFRIGLSGTSAINTPSRY